MGIPLPLTKTQLREIVQCYGTVFPQWILMHGQIFARTCGPIAQHIGFETLRSGAYRPWSGIGCLPLPTVHMLYQLLDVKHQTALLREHKTKWKSIVAAMEQQFRPDIRKPLDLWEVKRLCENAVKESTNDLCMLAILNAYLGEKEKAISCCERMQKAPLPTLAPRVDWQRQYREFGRQLRKAIEIGNERTLLERPFSSDINDVN